MNKVPLDGAIAGVHPELVDFVNNVPEGFYDEDPMNRSMSNAMRAVVAARALQTYAKDRGILGIDGVLYEEPATVLKDLLNDLMHFCDGHNLDFCGTVARATDVYEQELHDVQEERRAKEEEG